MAFIISSTALNRAIITSTQTSVNGYLLALAPFLSTHDSNARDKVYRKLIQRAWTEPQSQFIILRVLEIFKKSIHKYTPSPSLMTELIQFCDDVKGCLSLSTSESTSLDHFRMTLNRLRGSQPTPLPSQISTTPTLDPSGRPPLNKQLHEATLHQTLVTPPLLKRSNSASRVQATAPAPPSLDIQEAIRDLDSRPLEMPPWVILQDLPYGPLGAQIKASNHLDSSLPIWSVKSLGITSLSSSLPSSSKITQPDSSWHALLPELNISFSLGDPMEVPQGTVILASSILKCVLDVDTTDVPGHLIQVSEAIKMQQDKEKASLKAKEKEMVLMTATKSREGGGEGRHARHLPPTSPPPSQSLFHTLPYSQQDKLHVSEEDMSLIIEVVLGPAAASSQRALGQHLPRIKPVQEDQALPSNVAQRPQKGDQNDATSPPFGFLESQFHVDGFGPSCCSILLKLIVDMYLSAGPGSGYPLVLRMLSKGLLSPHPEPRARVFDLVFNLAVHSGLMRSLEEDMRACDSIQVRGSKVSDSGATTATTLTLTGNLLNERDSKKSLMSDLDGDLVKRHSSMPSSPKARTLVPPPQASPLGVQSPPVPVPGSGSGSKSDMSVEVSKGQWSEPGAFPRWLRALLFPLLCKICDDKESSELVWQSALSSLLHLTTHGGHFVSPWVQNLPPRALDGIMKAGLKYRWSPEIYSQLITLSCHLLLLPSNAALAAQAAANAVKSSTDGRPHGASPLIRPLPLGPGRSPATTGYLASPHGTLRSSSPLVASSNRPSSFAGSSGGGANALYSSASCLRRSKEGPLNQSSGGAAFQPFPDGFGLNVVLHHLIRAPTAMNRIDLTATLLQLMAPQEIKGMTTLISFVHFLGSEAFADTIHCLARCPRPGTATRVSEAIKSVCPHFCNEFPKGHAMLTEFLERLEECALTEALGEGAVGGSSYSPPDPSSPPPPPPFMSPEEVAEYVQATVSHIAGEEEHPDDPGSFALAWRSFQRLCSDPSSSSRKLASYWLHQALSQSFHTSQSNLMLLSPLSLKSAAAASSSQSKVPSWRGCLAESLLHAVRQVDGGCEMLLEAAVQAISDLRGISAAYPLDPEDVSATGGSLNVNGAMGSSETAMQALYVTLLWILQSGDTKKNLPTISDLGDFVLSALCRRPPTFESESPNAPPPSGSTSHPAAPPPSSTVASSFLSGGLGFSNEVLQVTHVELLVLLLKELSNESRGCQIDARGFQGQSGHLAAILPRFKSDEKGLQVSSALPSPPSPPSPSSVPASLPPHHREARATFWNDSSLERRLVLLLALMARCALDSEAFARHSLAHLMKDQIDSGDPRERYLAGLYLLHHWMLNQPHKYWSSLRQLIVVAQKEGDEGLLLNPYRKVEAMTRDPDER